MINPRDAIIAALTPGTPFNPHNYVYRAVQTLAQFAGVEPSEVMELILGDLSSQIQCKPNRKHPEQGVYAALRSVVELEGAVTEGLGPKIKILAGNAVAPAAAAVQADAPETEEEVEESEGPLTEEAADVEF